MRVPALGACSHEAARTGHATSSRVLHAPRIQPRQRPASGHDLALLQAAGPTDGPQPRVSPHTQEHTAGRPTPSARRKRLPYSRGSTSDTLRQDPALHVQTTHVTQATAAPVLFTKQTWGPDLRNRLKFLTDARVKGKPMRILFDTGASKNLITQQAASSLRRAACGSATPWRTNPSPCTGPSHNRQQRPRINSSYRTSRMCVQALRSYLKM